MESKKALFILSILTAATLGACSDDTSMSVRPPANCQGDECKTPECEGDDCKAPECEGDDCKTPECEGDDCKAPECEGDDCKTPECEGDDCKKPECEGDDCKTPECEGDDCKAPECEGDDCKKPECEGDDCKKPECEGDDCKTPECEGDDCIDPEPECSDQCAKNESRCDGNNIQRCEENERGCLVWTESKSCGSNMICDQATNTCVDGCVDECQEGAKECAGNLIKTCVKSEDSECTVWSAAESCGENKRCENNTCVDGCKDECKAGESICEGVKVRTCGQYDEDACLDLSAPQECGTNNACNEKTGKCEQLGCEDKCAEGELQCSSDKTAIMECKPDKNGCYNFAEKSKCGTNSACSEGANGAECKSTIQKICTAGTVKCSSDNKAVQTCIENSTTNEWKTTNCAANQTCDGATHTCKSTCTNACTENATQCKGTGTVQKCQKQSNGCTAWVDSQTCTSPQTCTGGACKSSCGSNCDPFSIVIIPDTQNYVRYTSMKTDSIYHKQMNWIVQNKDKAALPNLKMVIHMGDITNDNTDIQWQIAKDAQNILLNKNIPFTLMNGNHDYRVSGAIGGRSKTKFPQYFPKNYLEKIPGYAGVYSDVNTYYTFSGGGQNFLVLSLEYAPRQQTICWANNLLQSEKYKDYKTIVVTHGYVSHTYNDSTGKPNAKPSYCGKPKNEFVANGASGSELWKGLVARHSNIVMALSGHVGDSERREDTGYNGNLVEQILTDYQFEKPCSASSISGCTSHCAHVQDAGNGWLRVLTFYPAENRVVAKNYSVISGDKKTFSAKGTDQFFCSELFPEKDPKASLADWYPQNPNDKVHQYEFKYDFTTPKQNKYLTAKTGEYLGFVHRTINNTSTGDQFNSSVAVNDTGRAVYVWEDDSSSEDGTWKKGGNAHDIYARILIPGGCNYADHPQIIVPKNTAGHQFDPDVAMDKNGNFVVVWTDDNDNNGTTQIYMRGFNADGSVRFDTKTVNSVDTRDQYEPRIAMAPDGQFAISWTDKQFSNDTPQIMVRGFNANGSQSFADRPIADAVEGTRVHSDIFMDQNHNIVVVWEDDADANKSTQVRMRYLNANGTNKTNLITVNTDKTGNQDTPSISGKQDGSKIIVAWKNTASGNTSIMARTFNASGSQIDKDFTASKTAGTVTDPHVCMNNSGNAVITWYNSTKRNVYSNKFTSNTIGTSDTIVNSPGNESASANKYGYPKGAKSFEPEIACIPNGKARFITYTDDNDGNGTYEIFAEGEEF